MKMIVSANKAPLICSQRLTLAVLAFFGKLFVYSARVNLSVAILCMVRNDVTGNLTSLGQDSHNGPNHTNKADDERGEFDWDKSMQSHLLSIYFYGYICTQILGGWLSTKFGGRRVWGVCHLVSSICSLLTPMAARTHIYLASAIRFLLGLVAGVTFPTVHAMMGQWAPPLERSRMLSVTFAGPSIGMVATFAISGILCEFGFDNGWGSIFYLCGIFNLLWVLAWFSLTADSPQQHARISAREKDYITGAIGKGVVHQKRNVPWVKILSSRPVWAIICVHFCNNYTSYTLLTSLPMFMKEVLGFDITQNGALSSLPYLTQFFSSMFFGFLADTFNERKWIRVINIRRLFQSVSFLGTAALFCVVVQIDSSQRYVAVAILCCSTSIISANRGGYLVNYLDLAPSYAGIIFGITNTVGTIPGVIAPVIAGALTPNSTPEEWRVVFYVCAAVCVFGSISYVILVDASLQSWSVDEQVKDVKDGRRTELTICITEDGDYGKENDTGNNHNITADGIHGLGDAVTPLVKDM